MTNSTEWMTMREVAAAIRARKMSCREAVEGLLGRIDRYNGRINAYLDTSAGVSLALADAMDSEGPGEGEFWGVPIGIKDVIAVEGMPCRCGSRMLDGFVSPYDATAIRKLRNAGAIPMGRLNMDEFAMGSTNENSGYGLVRNPWDPERVPGGSSGGSAAAVASGMAYGALGSDTGGSIRQPASLCGVVGLKPTYGRVSRFGLVAFASSLDQIGPLARDVTDAALLFDVIAGYDANDSTSIQRPAESTAAGLGDGVKGLRIGLPREYFAQGLDPEVESAVRKAVDVLEGLGASVEEVSLPHTEYAVSTYYIIATAEASANLARFDGVRYGHRCAGAEDVADLYFRSREEGFGSEVKRRIILGTYVLSSGYYDAYYLRAQKARTLIRRDFEKVFEKVDILASAASPTPAYELGSRIDDPLQMYLGDVLTIPMNLAGNCGLSVPCGMTAGGLPIGLQLMGAPFAEADLLRAARAYEEATQWHDLKPDPAAWEQPLGG
jgi:aspartyl-tRNA(Asn)/glutamyl-tRNA(Gln) amidotransferase subunit A